MATDRATVVEKSAAAAETNWKMRKRKLGDDGGTASAPASAAEALSPGRRLALLTLADELQNVSRACAQFGVSRDTFYRIKRVYDKAGPEAISTMGQPLQRLDKRVSVALETSVLAVACTHPEWGPLKVSGHLSAADQAISPSGVRAVWKRHAITTVKNRIANAAAHAPAAPAKLPVAVASSYERPSSPAGSAMLEVSPSAMLEDSLGDSDTASSLLMSSLDLFARQNYSTVTIKDIAKATGINTSLIYYYFGSKEGLFMKVVELATRRAFESFDSIMESGSTPVQIISLWIENHVLQFTLMQKLIKISIDYANTRNHAPELEKAIRRFYDIEAEVLQTAIQTGIEQSLFAVVDPVRVAAFISTFLDGALIRSVMMPERDTISTILDMRSFVLEQLLKGSTRTAAEGPSAR